MNNQTILDVVRGYSSWSELQRFGVTHRDDVWSFPAYPSPIEVCGADILEGFKQHASRPAELREWASFLLAAASLVSFDSVEKENGGELHIERLWEVAEMGNATRPPPDAPQHNEPPLRFRIP